MPGAGIGWQQERQDQQGKNETADRPRAERPRAPASARVALVAHQLATAALERDPDGGAGPVEIEVAADRRTLAVATRFGGLDRGELEALVRACSERSVRTAAADDLGMASVLGCCRTVVVNAAPTRSTELIGLLPGQVDGVTGGAPSLHLSVTDPVAARACAGAPIETVDLSESMRNQLLDTASRGGFGTVEAVITPETSVPMRTLRARPRRSRVIDLRHAVDTIAAASTASAALKAALRYLGERFVGAVVFEVRDRSVAVWATAGGVADVGGLTQFMVQIDEACSLAFLAREAALVQGCPGSAALDRRLARLVAGEEQAYGVSLSVVVGGRVRYILYASEPWVDRRQAQRELELLGARLAHTLHRIEVDATWAHQAPASPASPAIARGRRADA